MLADIADVPVIDNHCHALQARSYTTVAQWRELFTESPDPGMRTRDVAETVFYRRLIRAMAQFHGVVGTEEEVLAARYGMVLEDLVARLFGQATIGGVVVDTGFPAPESAMAEQVFVSASAARYARLQRLELLLQDLIVKHTAYDELVEDVHGILSDVRGAVSPCLYRRSAAD